MPTVVLKLFAGQGTGRTKRRLYASPFGEHNKYIKTERNEIHTHSFLQDFSEQVISLLHYTHHHFSPLVKTAKKRKEIHFCSRKKKGT